MLYAPSPVMSNKLFFLLTTWLLLVALLPTATHTHAHGTRISYAVKTTVTVTAAYDSGEPMAGAQMTVYAPDDPTTAWLTGVADSDGRFTFTPDPDIPGAWYVQARQAGHGAAVHISIEETVVTASGATGFTTWQIIVMAVSVVWGLIGVAAYFHRRGNMIG